VDILSSTQLSLCKLPVGAGKLMPFSLLKWLRENNDILGGKDKQGLLREFHDTVMCL
jgi:hypothetical protein